MDALWRSWGTVGPPEKITQEAFNRDDAHLHRLVNLRPGQRAEAADLWDYTQDLLYTEIQGPLLAYLLPFCLNGWREDLRGLSTEYGGFVEWFYLALADRGIFDVQLNLEQGAAISEYMRRTIMEEIDDQRGLFFMGKTARPYRWVGALTTYGVLRPDVERLWNSWWNLDSIGRSIAAIQYISCLMYTEYKNPVFAPWTGNHGGGPPSLWDFEGHLYENRWLQPNVDFLKGALTIQRVSDVVTRAAERLVGQFEYDAAVEIRDHIPLCIETLKSRCIELPQLLEKYQKAGELLDWSR
jgi:hypothetical protein